MRKAYYDLKEKINFHAPFMERGNIEEKEVELPYIGMDLKIHSTTFHHWKVFGSFIGGGFHGEAVASNWSSQPQDLENDVVLWKNEESNSEQYVTAQNKEGLKLKAFYDKTGQEFLVEEGVELEELPFPSNGRFVISENFERMGFEGKLPFYPLCKGLVIHVDD